ncbi:DUF2264 domain-containing protein [Microbacterium sp. Leaf151]|uniref:DUF2264 domain-containing protein n=1 Tax=Microbacterium sp. Leaf151 TaxID=1736276 RepID=UPI0006F3A36D|nr:DUF2264 domain-containing protein [Microbacterium sp. Leaf151]KQR25767.1 hypothetical protein ASF76_00220 [Microbacterium sp. Leaf151]
MSVASHPSSSSTRSSSFAPGWTRGDWTDFADRLLSAAREYASENNARITFPGAEGGYGRAVDGLEGFARTFLLAAFRLTGDDGHGLEDLAAFYRRGVAAGVDPVAADRWVRMDEHPQAKVEAASLAVALDMTRPWIWDQLDAETRQRVIDYLAPVVGDDTYPKTNWLWFRVVVQTFLRSVGGPWSQDDITADLALHDQLTRADGWISDGFERSYDHYVGWALHVYPVLWPRMRGAADLAAGRIADVAALDRYLEDAVRLVGADGSPLMQGRSLVYRFAAAAPFWAGVLAGVRSTSLGSLRHAAEKVVRHFVDVGAPDERDILTLGWHGEWRDLAQSYSGPGSPYWAVKGLLGVMLPADHPVWAAEAEQLPVERGDYLCAVAAPGWVVSGTDADGIVRIANHGTDDALEGALVGDSPLYARIGYSTATAPLANERAWEEPLEQSVSIVDGRGRATHRAAMRLIDTRVQNDAGGHVAIAASVSAAHWISAAPAVHRHGSGLVGEVEVAGVVEVHSLLRGPWEMRLTRVVSLEPHLNARELRVRVGGWAVSGDDTDSDVDGAQALARSGAVRSSLVALHAEARARIEHRVDASPLGPRSAVPVAEHPLLVGEWLHALIGLAADDDAPSALSASVEHDGTHLVTITWPDGTVTTSRLTQTGITAVASR